MEPFVVSLHCKLLGAAFAGGPYVSRHRGFKKVTWGAGPGPSVCEAQRERDKQSYEIAGGSRG